MNTTLWSRIGLLGILLLPCTTSCVSNRGFDQAMAQKDGEIKALRDERAALKDQIQKMKSSLDEAHGQLATASAKMSEDVPAAVAPSTTEKMPELDGVGVSYGMRNGNMVLSIPSSITFASGEATLSKEGEKALKQVAATLKKRYGDAKYSIEGHTDSDPIKKSKFSSNRDLSISRARAVHTFLVEECGIPDSSCIVVGHGEYDAVAANDTKENKARNRRVEIVVHSVKGH